MHDLRHAFRAFVKNPGFTTVAVLTLALGIGANTAIFSVVNGVLLRPLPYGDPDRLVEVWGASPSEPRGNHSAPAFLDLQRNNRTLDAIAGYRSTMVTASVRPGEPVQLDTCLVTVDFFDVLRIQPLAGRTFSRKADEGSAERVVVLGHSAWRQLFAEDPNAVGQRIRVNGEPHTVIGVMPPRTEWPEGANLWVLSTRPVPPSPLGLVDDAPEAADDVGYISAIARIRPDVTIAQAQDDLRRIDRDTRQRTGASNDQGRNIFVGRLHDRIVGDVKPALLILQGAVGLVLLIACANVSSLLLVRASGRRRELAIRSALGAKRGRLIRQMLTESVMLGGIGALVGLLIGAWLLALLTRVLPDDVPRRQEITLDWVVAMITFGVALLCSALFGALPALQASQTEAVAALKEGASRSASGRSRGRSILVTAEIALTLVLLVGAGLLINSFLRLQRVDSGFRPEEAVVVSIAVPEARYPQSKAVIAFYDQLVERLRQRIPDGVAAIGFPAPLRGGNASGSFEIVGRNSPADDRPFANLAAVSGSYFEAIGMPLIAGRTFTPADRDDTHVAVVNAALVRKYFNGEDPIGRRIQFNDDASAPPLTIVGVVGDSRQLGLHLPPPPILYFSYAEFTLPFTNIVIRSGLPESAVASILRSELTALEPQLSMGDITTLQTLLDRSIAEPRSRSVLLGAFALLALVLAAVGLYGLISYSVTERTREIGIRVALGAPRSQVLGSVIREGMTLAAAGIGIGLFGAFVASRTLSRFLYGVGATDPLTFAAVSLLLTAVALLATYIPSRRAVRIDPARALRGE